MLINLGAVVDEAGEPVADFAVNLENLLRSGLLIQASARFGKSYGLRRLIEATAGLGEALVGGAVEPDRWRLRAPAPGAAPLVVEARIGRKAAWPRWTPSATWMRRARPAEGRGEPCSTQGRRESAGLSVSPALFFPHALPPLP